MDGSVFSTAPEPVRGVQQEERADAHAPAEVIEVFDLAQSPCDPFFANLLTPETAIALSTVPHSLIGGRMIMATARPDLAAEIARAVPDHSVAVARCSTAEITEAIGQLYGDDLARAAETRAPLEASARVWTGRQLSLRLAIPLILLLLGALLAPLATYQACLVLAFAVFALNMGLKLAAAAATLRGRQTEHSHGPRAIPLFREPVITLLVPLFNEDDIAGVLLKRIEALSYPKSRLDVIFILEASDAKTAQAIAACSLPPWARALVVPRGQPQTKPRALNYALPFARGTIIGIYDAEDHPEPDQLDRVAARFALAPPEVACLQGQLDYYNADHNWISRCFTIEYASWFRVLLPGVARLGLVVPLGGTTLFIKRDALIRVGAWDAHNVTEDAELGIRLQRHGYRTELLDTTTFEEANSALWPWIKQRSRWLKGYAITWATVMRRPGPLWRDLGARRFFGLQAQFAGTVLGFVTAPLLWTLPLLPLTGASIATPTLMLACLVLFTTALLATLWINWIGCRAPHLRRLRGFVLMMVIYYPLASASAVIALVELALKPFYWAKTAHGHYGLASASTASAAARSRTSNARDR